MSSSQDLEFPFGSEQEFELILGDSFLSSRPSNGFHTVRYDFKPASVDTSQPGNLEVGDGGEVTVSLPNIQDSGTTVYKGSKKPCPKECILIVDKENKTITLERLTSTIQLKKIRSAPTTTSTTIKNNQLSSHQVHQTEPTILPDDSKAQVKANSSLNTMIDSPGSKSSSSDSSDSDLEDVDEEVAQLNASLIGCIQTEQAKIVNVKGESSSSYNQICKDLELSESGSDSD